ncbi:MAG: hypothetical protein WBO69_20135 [Thermoanaerobaculia bacterium]
MITFVTLFLGLVLGPKQVDLLVEGDPAAVVLQLDGVEIDRKSGQPWSFDCDLGPRLAPHKLEALALNKAGEVQGRAIQWINLPRSRAEVAFLLEGEDPQRPDSARLVWKHIEFDQADSIRLRFDGREVPYDGLGIIRLPEYDPAKLHVLEADLQFPDGAHYEAELSFGTRLGFGAEIDLTGLALEIARGSQPSIQELEGWFEKDGSTMEVVGIERSPARIVMVIDETAKESLRELATVIGGATAGRTALRKGEEVLFLFPQARKTEGGDHGSKLFTLSQPFTEEHGDLAWLLTRVSVPTDLGTRRVTDALAVAGLEAATGGRPRAVILVLGHEATDTSAYQVDEVTNFLRDLRVPWWVWWTGRPSAVTVSEGRRPVRVDTSWGKATDISSFSRIEQAVEDLRQSLDRQHTVWVSGSHLPNRITLTSKAAKAEFAGQD